MMIEQHYKKYDLDERPKETTTSLEESKNIGFICNINEKTSGDWVDPWHQKRIEKARISLNKEGIQYVAQEEVPGPDCVVTKWLNTKTLMLNHWDDVLNVWVCPIRDKPGQVKLVAPTISSEIDDLTDLDYFYKKIAKAIIIPASMLVSENELIKSSKSPLVPVTEESDYDRAMKIVEQQLK